MTDLTSSPKLRKAALVVMDRVDAASAAMVLEARNLAARIHEAIKT
jgi:hypothetical protein